MAAHNVILFGESGSGKSSVVNMIVGREVAKVSNDPLGCTFRYQQYGATLNNIPFQIYDTAGLNEGDQGRVPHWTAIRELYTLIRELDGVSLLIYCIRGRIKENTHANWILFNDVICGGHVPIILVVTGLENEEDLMDPARHKRIEASFDAYKMKPKAVATVVPIRGIYNEYADLYEASQKQLHTLILSHHRAWSTEKEVWFKDIYVTAYSTGFGSSCFGATTKVEFAERTKTVIQEFVAETRMKEDESKKLHDALLGAERKLKKKGMNFKMMFAAIRGTGTKDESRSVSDKPTGVQEKGRRTAKHNIILFGESGSGKSSLVNMIVDKEVAKVASGALGCTFQSDPYDAIIGNANFCIHDTAGLNEEDHGRVPHWRAVRELYTLIRTIDGVSLLVYCVRGRIRENFLVNWVLFHKVICAEKVPIIVVRTGQENEEDWENESDLRSALQSYNMKATEVTNVVATKGRKNVHEVYYQRSQERLKNMIARCHLREPWSAAKDEWFTSIYHTTYTTGVCFLVRTEVEFNDRMRIVIDNLVEATPMKKDEYEKLRENLRKAERKVLESKKITLS